MVTFITGRSGVGKTEYLMEQLPVLAEQYRRVFFLVPEQSSLGLERRIGSLGLGNVQVSSFRRLCNEIFRAYGGVAGNYMSASRQTALIYRVLQEQRKNLVYYRTAAPSMGFVSRLSEVFEEFSMAGLEESAVLPALAQSGREDWQEKYKDLFLLYNAYRSALDAENRSAAEDLAAATRLAEEQGYFENTAVVLDGFFGFTGRQRELLKVIFGQSAAVYCALLLDPASKDLLFEPIALELAGLRRLARDAGAQTKEIGLEGPSKRLKYADLQCLEQRLFAVSAAPFKAEHIRLFHGRNMREELAMVAADIAKKVREQGYRYREIALVSGSLEEYGAVAANIFRKYGIPLFLDEGQTSMGKPIFAFVQSALRIISPERYFRKEDVLLFLKTGLCGEDRDLIARLENYCTLWEIQGKRFTAADWTKNPLGTKGRTPEGEALLQQLNGLRRRMTAPLLRFKDSLGSTGADLARAIYQLLCDFKVEEQMERIAQNYRGELGANAWETQQNQRLAREYLGLYSAMTDILDDIYAVFETAPLSIYAMEELIGLCAEQTALNVAPPTLDAVSLGGVARSRFDGVRALYVVGANQGILPAPAKEGGLIADRERQFFTEKELPCNATVSKHNLQGQHRLYAALFSAQEELVFSYSAFKIKGEVLFPSVYIDKLKALTEIKPITRAEMSIYDFALTPEGARELIGWEPALRREIMDVLGEKAPEERPAEDRLPLAIANRIFGDKLKLSYSQIGEYQKCPFQYFMKKTMGIESLKPIGFNAENIGTYIHYGLETLVNRIIKENAEGNGVDYAAYDEDAIRRFGEEMAQDYLRDQLKDFERSARFDALYERMTGLFCRVAKNVIEELRDGQYQPYGTEVSIDGITLPLDGGKKAILSGSVDRVDICEKDGKTYLKVTDYKTGKKQFRFEGITNRENVQLPLYLYGLIKSGKFTAPVPAVGCYMEAQAPHFDTLYKDAELEDAVREFYRRGGFFRKEDAVLEALDGEQGSRHYKIVYNKPDKSGVRPLKKGTPVYAPELIDELTDYMETVIKETAEEILGGNIAAYPLKGADIDGCKYCEYGEFCGFDANQSPCREYSKDKDGWRKEAEE